jgi:uncharacterized protein YggU (UPF0235/DUF167 family)
LDDQFWSGKDGAAAMAAFFPIPFRILNLEFPVNIVSGCRQAEISGPAADGTMTVKILSAGATRTANAEVRGVLSRYYNVPRSAVEIQDGNATPGKRVRIAVKLASNAALRSKIDRELERTPALARV